ncbi:MAG: S8 family serine peptidase [Steroidobacteraceae bacterium]
MASAVNHIGRLVAIAAFTSWTAAVGAAAPATELELAITSARPGEDIPVIVSYRSQTTAHSLKRSLRAERRSVRRLRVVRELTESASADEAPLLATARAYGARDVRSLWIANAVAMRASPELIRALQTDPAVLQLRLDASLAAPLPMVGDPLPAEWNINLVRAPELWQRGFQGEGAVIAIVDTGVDALHPDLAASYRGGSNSWFDAFSQYATPRDLSGHGTQVAGLALGGTAGGTSIGVAPRSRWIAARIFDNSGSSSESAVHLAFQWLLDPDGNPATDDAPDVVNNSWSTTDAGFCNSLLQPDIDALNAADIAVVFAGGNYGPAPGTSTSPANNANVVSVGAIDATETIALYSSRGPSACDGGIYPEVVAPGDSVLTTDLSFGGSPFYTLVSGTSFAAPHLSGLMALLRGAAPTATVEAVEAAVQGSARDLGIAGPDGDYGHGLIDAVAALDMLEVPADNDGDGYSVTVDCNDNDPSVYPGAPERWRDRIDQDCNGYDLTIRVFHAVYSHDGSSLRLRATSSLGESAALEIVELGPLTWRAVYHDWIWGGGAVGEPLPRLTIRGIEGEVSTKARVPKRR